MCDNYYYSLLSHVYCAYCVTCKKIICHKVQQVLSICTVQLESMVVHRLALVLRRLATRDALERCISETWPAALQRCGRYLPWILIRSQCFRVRGPYILPCTPSMDGSRMALVGLCRALPRARGGSAEAETCVRAS